MVFHRGEALNEAVELRDAMVEAIRGGDVEEVVDAEVLLQDPDIEFLRYSVELGDEDRVHRLAAGHRNDLLLQDLPLGELEEQVLRERGEGHVLAVCPAAVVD